MLDAIYEGKRQGWRLECGEKCVLKHCGISVECMLVDISISGVLVSIEDDFIVHIREGDECGVSFYKEPHAIQPEIVCTVVRKDSGLVGLQFPMCAQQGGESS